ncbi:MAG: glycogen/starch synthase [Tissierellia bacterium]|nr:glycogen/starch synthase [Tissierellia bacterium]
MSEKLNILYAASEALPFIRTCDVADFVYNMTRIYRDDHHRVKVVLPLYRSIKDKYDDSFRYLMNYTVEMGFSYQLANILTLDVEGVEFLFIDNEHYFSRDRILGEPDDAERYIFFNKAILKLMREIDFHPHILHVHDYPTALLPAYVKNYRQVDDFYMKIRSVLSIHNIRNQGIFPAEDGAEMAGLPMSFMEDPDYQYYPCINFLKTGIATADHITLPSPTFKEEVQIPYYGEKLDRLMKANAFKTSGILDGIDYRRYDPERSPTIFFNYNKESLEQKQENKMGILNYYGLDASENRMLVGVICRLINRKGCDLLVDNLDYMVEKGMNVIVMGTGETSIEDAIIDASLRHPQNIAAKIYLNEKEKERILAGSDCILMPSRTEMQATNQLIAMRYGTVPMVRATGALKDSVRPFNKFSKKGEGFLFSSLTDKGLRELLDQATEVYFEKPDIFRKMQENAMEKDSSWEHTARGYMEIYKELINY